MTQPMTNNVMTDNGNYGIQEIDGINSRINSGICPNIQAQQIILAHQQLEQYMNILRSNASLINAHCYSIDHFTLICKTNIERECGDIIKTIENHKDELIKQLYEIQKIKTQNARNIYIAISNELDLCNFVNSEIENFIKQQTHSLQESHSIIFKINQICSNQSFLSLNHSKIQETAEIKANFFQSTKSKIIAMLKTFGGFVQNKSLKNNKNSKNNKNNKNNKNKNNYNDYQRLEDKENINYNFDIKRRPREDENDVSFEQRRWRENQIEIAKETQGFKNLIKLHPKYLSGSWRKANLSFVDIPKIDEKIGKKRWRGKYTKWRVFLHQFADQ